MMNALKMVSLLFSAVACSMVLQGCGEDACNRDNIVNCQGEDKCSPGAHTLTDEAEIKACCEDLSLTIKCFPDNTCEDCSVQRPEGKTDGYGETLGEHAQFVRGVADKLGCTAEYNIPINEWCK
eukprot:gnl/TRDRNA2_/TRDRNA2_86136_c0_seq1.p3 gnl/TRDRNA2_/TRDRNA2_86136_c0~~gnl/TRDRNA2_/TRDRNA2_86136_c0_seq1.p3  ORF type:complete len:124 (-),score=14.09 gnl/TRDRNA2_/TRDRNA2_86136_c0_seq1:103-474(-)